MTKEILLPEADSLNKDISFSEFLVRCNIPGIGAKMSERIACRIKNVATLRDLIECGKINEVLDTVSGIGEKSKKVIDEYLRNFDFMMLLDDLESEDYNMFEDDAIYAIEELVDEEEEKEVREISEETIRILKNLDGCRICITGTLSMPRKYFQNFIEKNGGRFQTAVNNSTEILIYSDKDGKSTSKFKKASDINSKKGFDAIKIINEDDFMSLVKTLGKI